MFGKLLGDQNGPSNSFGVDPFRPSNFHVPVLRDMEYTGGAGGKSRHIRSLITHFRKFRAWSHQSLLVFEECE
jgi:hypothetical protein